MKVVDGASGRWSIWTVSKNMKKRPDELEIRGTIETIQTTALLKSADIQLYYIIKLPELIFSIKVLK